VTNLHKFGSGYSHIYRYVLSVSEVHKGTYSIHTTEVTEVDILEKLDSEENHVG
jgi:hypothetical protein